MTHGRVCVEIVARRSRRDRDLDVLFSSSTGPLDCPTPTQLQSNSRMSTSQPSVNPNSPEGQALQVRQPSLHLISKALLSRVPAPSNRTLMCDCGLLQGSIQKQLASLEWSTEDDPTMASVFVPFPLAQATPLRELQS